MVVRQDQEFQQKHRRPHPGLCKEVQLFPKAENSQSSWELLTKEIPFSLSSEDQVESNALIFQMGSLISWRGHAY